MPRSVSPLGSASSLDKARTRRPGIGGCVHRERLAPLRFCNGTEISYRGSLQRFGERGHMVPELRDPTIRELLVGPFRLIYKLTGDEAQILAFIHGARNFPATWRHEQGEE